MKILWIAAPTWDYTPYIHRGLRAVVGDGNVHEYPYKSSLRGKSSLVAGEALTPLPNIRPPSTAYPTISEIVDTLYDLVVLESPRDGTVVEWSLMKRAMTHLPPVALIDWEDRPAHFLPNVEMLKPDFIFRSEFIDGQSPDIIGFPLTACNDVDDTVGTHEEIDVFGVYEENVPIRREVVGALRNLASDTGIHVVVGLHTENIRYWYFDYWRLLGKSGVAVVPHGRAQDTIRFYESGMCGALIVAQRRNTLSPHPLVDGVHCLWWDTVEEMVGQVVWALDNPVEARGIADAGRNHILRYHTPEARAEAMLKGCGVC